MTLYAVYVSGVLIDQISAENEDTCFARLKIEYPDIKHVAAKEITFEVIDPDFKPAVAEDEREIVEVRDEQLNKPATEEKEKAVAVIQADRIEITLNVTEGTLSADDIERLEAAATNGMVVAQRKGN